MGWGYDSKTYNSARIPRITGYAFMKEHFREGQADTGASKGVQATWGKPPYVMV
jgi:hypothetical protein